VTDPFAALGLPRAQALDLADLDRRLRERAREVHPDRFSRAPAPERARAAAASAALHAAHRALKDPLARAEALLALAGRSVQGARPAPELLEAQLAAREAIARGDGADARESARVALAGCERKLAELLAPGAGVAALDGAVAALVEARFHASLLRAAGDPPATPRPGQDR